MAPINNRGIKIKRSWILGSDYYLAVNQLVTALAIEHDVNVIESLRQAVYSLIPYNRIAVQRRLREAHADDDLIESIAICLATGSERVKFVVAEMLGMTVVGLERYVIDRGARFESSKSQFESSDSTSQADMRREAYAAIRSAGARLKAIDTLRQQSQPTGINPWKT